ncbi:MAG: phenylalanine--tRNA ligase subunit alpha [Phycisphaerales bacterium]
MPDRLDTIEREALAGLGAAADAGALEAWRIEFLGSKGRLKAAMAELKSVPAPERPAFGERLNRLKGRLEEEFKTRQGAAERTGSESGGTRAGGAPGIDLTEPGLIETRTLGRRHILTRVREELVEVFARMGFEVAEGPELEDDEHNFVKLNIPAGHPAREPSDNFYVDDPEKAARPRMLRSQTSTVQVRVMEKAVAAARAAGAPEGSLLGPIRIIAPGRVYRPDTVDATHSFMFHQLEGLALDNDPPLTMADLKTTLLQFARAYFGGAAEVRLRPSYFPFTEPSAELDMKIALKPGEAPRWIELGGCGMVDPMVLAACGIDPEEWTGFAFGFGIERIAMGRYGVPDIRMLFENDVRFLRRV